MRSYNATFKISKRFEQVPTFVSVLAIKSLQQSSEREMSCDVLDISD